ncbi:Major facilitator superfamily domain general substrate transporter [Penicillium malachiteum]|uniref:Major facilitator superfamily domain general substrate transporter n=1 Tax=Penicillium malachiteum TaxID=1324776 RepID=UPI00254718BA|nr:Major facilitator superfamily domain general substrate transporter [Penicillium malachiteum]KAJ5721298.1 Major facilitator superfamily domain general substrate transporter [Penicillium malachiteum]
MGAASSEREVSNSDIVTVPDEETGPQCYSHRSEKAEDVGEKTDESITNSTKSSTSRSPWKVLINTLLWAPPWCRWDKDNPPTFGMPLNILFAFAGTFTVANLYYAQPLEDTLAGYFNVSHERASLVPTCSQAGYAVGLILLCPLGDLIRRRPFVLLLTFITAALWIGLCITDSFNVFLAINFLSSVTTVTPQIMLPLVGDLAPPARRATALSIVSSGLVLGLLFARLLAGIIASYSSWRNVYWLALGMQFAIFSLLWAFMPDYQRTNTDITYVKVLTSIVRIFISSPVLVYATFMGFCLSATFTSFWTTLTFLLSGNPYNCSTVTIGLFSLAGLTPMFLGPFYSRYVIDKFATQVSILISLTIMLAGICIGTYTGTFSVAGPILQAALQDFGLQMTQIANRTAIYSVAPKARSRVNTAYMIGVFCGQLTGTAVGNRVYGEKGWIMSGSVSVVFVVVAFIICLIRGPAEKGWIGWTGGIRIRKVEAQ